MINSMIILMALQIFELFEMLITILMIHMHMRREHNKPSLKKTQHYLLHQFDESYEKYMEKNDLY